MSRLSQCLEASSLSDAEKAPIEDVKFVKDKLAAAQESKKTIEKKAKPPTKLQLKQVDDIITSMSHGGKSIEDMARAISTMDTPEQVASFTKNINRATTKDVFFEVWINALLSGPQTHAVNSISNSLVAFWQIPERLMAAGYTKLLNTGEDGVRATEAIGQAYGMVHGIKDGIKSFARTVITGEPEDIVGKIEVPIQAAISSESLNISGGLGRAVDYIGRGVRVPGTLLNAEDAFFKSVGYRMELNARAYRQSAEEGLTGVEAGKRMQDIIKNPPDDIHVASIDASRYQTFTNPLGEAGKAYQKIIANIPVLRVITPFVRTPTNIFKFFGERSPFAPLANSFRADIRAGGSRRDLALARVSLGSSVMAVAATFAGEGKITGGGPADKKLAAMMRNTGWQPYSIKVGGKYIAYGRLEPLGTLLGVAADFSEISGSLKDHEAQEIVAHLSMAVAQNLTSKTFLRGISEAVNAIDDPVRYGERWWQNFAGTVVPTGISQISRVNDPYLREVRSVSDKIKSRIPGYSKDLPPRRNIWGEPIILSGGLGPDIVSPFYTSTVKDDPVSKELVRIQSPITMPGRYIQDIELDSKQYDRLVILTGKEPIEEGEPNLKQAIAEVMKDPEYKTLTDGPDGGKSYIIRRIVLAYKKAAKAKFVAENPLFMEQIQTKIEARQTKLSGN